MRDNPYEKVPTGAAMRRNSGELAFDLAINLGSSARAGTFDCIFLEPAGSGHSKVVNELGRIQVVPNGLLSVFKL